MLREILVWTVVLVVATHSGLQGDDRAEVVESSSLHMEVRVAFTEGPAWHPTGNVYFSDIANNRIMRRDRLGELHVYRTPSGRTNGLLFDQLGRLLACEGGGPLSNRRVTRTESDGTITILADRFQHKRLNSPNDLTIDSQGRIYFSDPRYGARTGLEQYDRNGREIEGVYRIDGVGSVVRVLEHEVDRPNGLAIAPDDRFLYVADNLNDGPRAQGGARRLWRFTLQSDGNVVASSRKLMFDWGGDRGPDGMAIDRQGRLYVAAGFNFPNPPVETSGKFKAGIYVISTEGHLLQFVPIPADMITNCAFGGPDFKTLYVTAGHKLWSLRTAAVGHVAWPPRNRERRR